ncbi:Peptide deformylase [Streptomyces griseus]
MERAEAGAVSEAGGGLGRGDRAELGRQIEQGHVHGMVGEDILRRRCREVTAFGTPELSRLVDESEGCLSVPGPYRVVPRPDRAVVRGRDQDGEPLIIDGRAARLGT